MPDDIYSNSSPMGSPEQFKKALLAVRDRVPDMTPYVALLRAHCRAPKHTISMSKLAEEVGYTNYASANLQYGNLAHYIVDGLRITLPPTPSGEPHWWRVVAYGNKDTPQNDQGHYEWIMRPELVQALEELKWA
jgi:hypothetical protein